MQNLETKCVVKSHNSVLNEICPEVKLDGETNRPVVRRVKWQKQSTADILQSGWEWPLWELNFASVWDSVPTVSSQSGGIALRIWGKLGQMCWVNWRLFSKEDEEGGTADRLTGSLPLRPERENTIRQRPEGNLSWYCQFATWLNDKKWQQTVELAVGGMLLRIKDIVNISLKIITPKAYNQK